MGKCCTCFFVFVLAVNNNSIIFFTDCFGTVPYFFYEWTCRIILNRINSFFFQKVFYFYSSAECGNYHDIIGSYFIPPDKLFAIIIHYKFYTAVLQVFVYVGIVNHFAKQKNSLAGIFIDCFIGNLNCVLNPITESKVACNQKYNRTKIQTCRCKILFARIVLFTQLFYVRYNRTLIMCGDIKLLH